MSKNAAKSVSRRRFLKTTSATVLAASAGPAVIIPGHAQPKTLKILIGRSSISAINQWIAAEAAAQQGHDIVMYWEPLAQYEDRVIGYALNTNGV